MRHLVAAVIVAAGLAGPAAARAGDAFTFTIDGDRFTYTDAARTVTGRAFVPATPGLHGALVLNHGQGGSPTSFPNWSTFASWDVVLLAPELTHVLGGETLPETTGFTPENLARIVACVDALASLAGVDASRIGMFGHSKGAYATIGAVSSLGTRVRVAAMTAGGVVPDAFGTAQAAPTWTESAGVVAPFLMLHGNVDGSVPPERSLDFSNRLSAASVVNLRHVYDVTALPPPTQHNFHQDPAINADLVLRLHDWFDAHGLFAPGDAAVFADGFE
jgi:dienelactone hydrolase